MPEILDPGGDEDPRNHIRFNGAAVEGITDIGRKTIQALGLDRGDLTTARLQHLKLLNALQSIATLSLGDHGIELSKKGQAAQKTLQQMIAVEAIYSSMACDFLN